MKKYLLRFAIAGVLLFSLVSGSAWAQGRIATVDMTRVVANYYRKQQVDAHLKERVSDVEKEIKDQVDRLKKMKDDYDALLKTVNEPGISPAEREKRENALTEKRSLFTQLQNALEDYRQSSRARIQEDGNRLMGNLLTDITNAISVKAKASGFSLVIDTSGISPLQGAPIVPYSNGENDITDAILTKLNAGAPSDATKPEEKAPVTPVADPKKAGKK